MLLTFYLLFIGLHVSEGQSRGQTESQELESTTTQHKTQDEVTYSTVVHSNTTTTTTTVTDIEEKTEYAAIRVNE
ncbi:hypothetical protein SRHO_G00074180 [Serrasalmus rhombeus]